MVLSRNTRHFVLFVSILLGAQIASSSWSMLALYLTKSEDLFASVSLDDPSSSKWFILHPVLAIIGTVCIPVPGVILRKYKGYWSKKIHALFFTVSMLCIIFSMYIVWVNKESRGKPHLSSWHALGGAAYLVAFLALFLVGVMALDPDLACFSKSNSPYSSLKWIHKSGGRLLLVLGYWICFSGWYKFFEGSDLALGAVVASVASILTYIDPLVSRFGDANEEKMKRTS
jgi:hypothetical protein